MQLNKLLKALFVLEFILILTIISLTLIENTYNKKIPTAFAIKENSSIEKTNFKTSTKAVCKEKSEHIGSVDNDDSNKILIDNGASLIKINVEIADDNEERIKGLMFREKLNENEGMFFIFEDESYQTFWMENTLIPLDIIFIGKNFKIVDIKNAIPCKEEPCVLYKSSKPAKYVLEANGNFTMKNNVKIGNKITTNYFVSKDLEESRNG